MSLITPLVELKRDKEKNREGETIPHSILNV